MTLGLAGIDNSYCNTKVQEDYIYKTLVLKYTLTFALLKPGGCHLGPESHYKTHKLQCINYLSIT